MVWRTKWMMDRWMTGRIQGKLHLTSWRPFGTSFLSSEGLQNRPRIDC
jgi:hypothetical protein